MRTIKSILAVLFLFSSIQLVSAQDMKAEKYENPKWVQMVYVKFKPMKKGAAMKVVEEYFAKADANAGIDPPTVYHFATGEYDMMVVWDMKEGVETLNYEMTPDDVKWMKEMAKLAGGQDKAMGKMEEFYSYVADWKTAMARKE